MYVNQEVWLKYYVVMTWWNDVNIASFKIIVIFVSYDVICTNMISKWRQSDECLLPGVFKRNVENCNAWATATWSIATWSVVTWSIGTVGNCNVIKREPLKFMLQNSQSKSSQATYFLRSYSWSCKKMINFSQIFKYRFIYKILW